jgi:carnosine N-methyltransferase
LEKIGYKKKLEQVDEAILKNSEFLNQIVANPEIFGHDLNPQAQQDDENISDLPPDSDHTEHQGKSIVALTPRSCSSLLTHD